MGTFDSERPFVGDDDFDEYVALGNSVARRYGKSVRAVELANIQYKFRYQKLRKQKNMKPPPSTGRIFTGFLVVCKIDTPEQYETWMPDHVFNELYRSMKAIV